MRTSRSTGPVPDLGELRIKVAAIGIGYFGARCPQSKWTGLQSGGRLVRRAVDRNPNLTPFWYLNSSPEVIRSVVMMYVRFPLSLRNVEDLLFERGIDICHETVRLWWNRFGPLFAADIRRQRVSRMRGFRYWRWHLDEVFVRINGERHYLCRAVDHEDEIRETFVTKRRDKVAAFKFLKKALKRHGSAEVIVTDGLHFHPAAMRELGNLERREVSRWKSNQMKNCK
jgi:putative transposase